MFHDEKKVLRFEFKTIKMFSQLLLWYFLIALLKAHIMQNSDILEFVWYIFTVYSASFLLQNAIY